MMGGGVLREKKVDGSGSDGGRKREKWKWV